MGHVTTRAFGLLPCPARVCALLLRIPYGSPTPCGQHADNPKIIAADGSTREHRAYHKGTAVCRVCRLHDDGHLHKPGGAGPACGNSGDVPRSTFAATAIRSLKTPADLGVLWTIHKASEMARLELYVAHALRSARAGQLEAARDVALESVGHVSLEDPRPHLLLGRLAVVLRDRTLLEEARRFLAYFNHESSARKLALTVESGHALFEDGD